MPAMMSGSFMATFGVVPQSRTTILTIRLNLLALFACDQQGNGLIRNLSG